MRKVYIQLIQGVGLLMDYTRKSHKRSLMVVVQGQNEHPLPSVLNQLVK